MSHLLSDFQAFLQKAPTSWHAAHEMGLRLALCDFTPLQEEEAWQLERGKRYFVQRGGSVAAFVLPKGKITQARILGAHTDSPALKLKPNPLFYKENMALLRVEPYGAPLLSSWLGRDLAIAGRIVIQGQKGTVEEKLLFLEETLFTIPQLAIHLDREVNEKGLLLNKQEHLCPLLGLTHEKFTLEKVLQKAFPFQKLLSFDLFLVPVETPSLLGLSHEFLASYRLDNLTSVHAALAALSQQKEPEENCLKMIYCTDHEEIGSGTMEGASSPFLLELLERICVKGDLSQEEISQMNRRSLIISIDMAHALHPNYIDKHDPQHQPLFNQGIVLKFNANHKYASNAQTAAHIVASCERLKIPFQTFACRSDIPCGSTIGPLLAEKTGIPTVDIGIAQLSMHGARELIACEDYAYLYTLLQDLLIPK